MPDVQRHATVYGVSHVTRGSGRDIVASVRQRLLNRSRQRDEDFQYVLTRFGLERLLYRLAKSRHATSFVLKGPFCSSCGAASHIDQLVILTCWDTAIPTYSGVPIAFAKSARPPWKKTGWYS